MDNLSEGAEPLNKSIISIPRPACFMQNKNCI